MRKKEKSLSSKNGVHKTTLNLSHTTACEINMKKKSRKRIRKNENPKVTYWEVNGDIVYLNQYSGTVEI